MSALKAWRERHKVTQESLSVSTGIPQSLLSKYERGPHRPGLQNALAIARATGGEVPVEVWDRSGPDLVIASEPAPPEFVALVELRAGNEDDAPAADPLAEAVGEVLETYAPTLQLARRS